MRCISVPGAGAGPPVTGSVYNVRTNLAYGFVPQAASPSGTNKVCQKTDGGLHYRDSSGNEYRVATDW